MKRIFLLTAAMLALAGCHAVSQVPPSAPPTASITWTAPAANGGAAYTYVVSRATATGTTCPVTTGTAYTPLNQTTPTTALNYTDSTVTSGSSYCYIAQTLQSGLVSAPSSPSAVLTVPTVPGPPTAPAVTAQP
jgi:hypothetical protein